MGFFPINHPEMEVSIDMGLPQWLVSSRRPDYKWMMSRGTPHFGKPPNGVNHETFELCHPKKWGKKLRFTIKQWRAYHQVLDLTMKILRFNIHPTKNGSYPIRISSRIGGLPSTIGSSSSRIWGLPSTIEAWPSRIWGVPSNTGANHQEFWGLPSNICGCARIGAADPRIEPQWSWGHLQHYHHYATQSVHWRPGNWCWTHWPTVPIVVGAARLSHLFCWGAFDVILCVSSVTHPHMKLMSKKKSHRGSLLLPAHLATPGACPSDDPRQPSNGLWDCFYTWATLSPIQTLRANKDEDGAANKRSITSRGPSNDKPEEKPN